jgi:hypothetical protein
MALDARLRSARRLGALSHAERRVVLSAFAWLLLVDVGLRLRNFRFVVSRARSVPPQISASVSLEQVEEARRLAHWIDVAARHHFVSARCLHRALVLHFWLRDRSLPSQLRIGVRTAGGVLVAHAWIELDGNVVDDAPDWVALFTPLAALDGQQPNWSRAANWDVGGRTRSVEAA